MAIGQLRTRKWMDLLSSAKFCAVDPSNLASGQVFAVQHTRINYIVSCHIKHKVA